MRNQRKKTVRYPTTYIAFAFQLTTKDEKAYQTAYITIEQNNKSVTLQPKTLEDANHIEDLLLKLLDQFQLDKVTQTTETTYTKH